MPTRCDVTDMHARRQNRITTCGFQEGTLVVAVFAEQSFENVHPHGDDCMRSLAVWTGSCVLLRK